MVLTSALIEGGIKKNREMSMSSNILIILKNLNCQPKVQIHYYAIPFFF